MISQAHRVYFGKRNFYCCCLITKSCQLFCFPMDCSPPGSFVCGISRLEYWSGFPFSSPGDLPGSGIKPVSPALAGRFTTTEPLGKFKLLLLLDNHRIFPSPGDLPDPGIEPRSPALQADALTSEPLGKQ